MSFLSDRNVLTDHEKKAYIDAELCLINAPPRGGTPGARNRFEELQYLHIIQTPYIHFVVSCWVFFSISPFFSFSLLPSTPVYITTSSSTDHSL